MGGVILRVGHWEVKSRHLFNTNGAAVDCNDSWEISEEKNISLETSYLKGNRPFFTLHSLAMLCRVGVCLLVCMGCGSVFYIPLVSR